MADRMVYGTMDLNGLKLNGAGFTCQRVSKGTYSIYFSQAFPSVPVVTVTFTTSSANADNVATVNPSAQSCLVYTYDGNGSGGAALQDSGFNFIAIGPA